MVERYGGRWTSVLTCVLTALLLFVLSPRLTAATALAPAVPTVSLVSSLNPSYVSEAVTLTATVTVPPGDPVPTGDVRFMDGTNLLATVALNGSAQAVHVDTTFISANHALRAEYLGDATTSPATSPTLNQLVYRYTPIIEGTVAPNPSHVGEAVTATVTVSGGAGTPVPTGNVRFSSENTLLAIATLDNSGQAQVVTSALAAGPRTITVVYPGGIVFQGGMTNIPLTVEKNAPQVSLVSSNNPSLAGLPVTFTATVRGSAAGAPPGTGAVVFKEGFAVLTTGALDANGQATFTTSSLAAGSHAIAVEYAGDAYYLDGTSAPLVQTVNLVGASVLLVSSDNPSVYAQSVTFTATATGSSVTPTGAMTFKEGATILGTANLDGAGVASYSTASLAAGSHSIAAEYGGDSIYSPGATGMITQIVDRAPTTTLLSVSTGSTTAGTAITWMAAVSSPAAGTIDGTVTFSEGLTILGTGTLSPVGFASVTTSLPAGIHDVTATFSGATNFDPSTSAPVTTVVTEPDAGIDAGVEDAASDAKVPDDDVADSADGPPPTMPPPFDGGRNDADAGANLDAADVAREDIRADISTEDASMPPLDVASEPPASRPDVTDDRSAPPAADARGDIAADAAGASDARSDVARGDGGSAPEDDDRGCGCRMGRRSAPRAWWALTGALVAVGLLRARGRRGKRPSL